MEAIMARYIGTNASVQSLTQNKECIYLSMTTKEILEGKWFVKCS